MVKGRGHYWCTASFHRVMNSWPLGCVLDGVYEQWHPVQVEDGISFAKTLYLFWKGHVNLGFGLRDKKKKMKKGSAFFKGGVLVTEFSISNPS